MKKKTSCNNNPENQKNDVIVSDKAPACDAPLKNNSVDYSVRKNKTWCSYMENGFRETRDMIEIQDDSNNSCREKIVLPGQKKVSQ